LLLMFLMGLCVTGLLIVGLVLLMDRGDSKGIRRQAEQQRAAREAPTTPPAPVVRHPVSERRIANDGRKLIEEIEHFLADPRSS
jgi:hypothetical protein